MTAVVNTAHSYVKHVYTPFNIDRERGRYRSQITASA